jgi:hypothetical protein
MSSARKCHITGVSQKLRPLIIVSKLKLVSVFALLLATTPLLSASNVTSGYIQVSGGIFAGSFNLSGPGFWADGAFDAFNFWAINYGGIAPESAVSIYGTVWGNDFRTGSATVAGTYSPYVIWGDLFAQSSSFFELNGPKVQLGSTAGTYFGTFDFFIGSLCGTLGNEIPAPCVADLPGLGGSGIVSLDVSEAVGQLWVDQVTYTFLTPEPGTLALLGSGLLGGWAVIRRRFVR